jgi:uncharacterized membrane protein
MGAKNMNKKEIAYERVLFFSDAIVAIAITLLALDLRLNVPPTQHITFIDLIAPWQKYLAFILSFLNIAGFWRTHHDFFIYIKKMDQRMMLINTLWLFFIVALPFSTSVVSQHFGDPAAIFLYCINVFSISVCQNFIWDYAFLKTDYTDKESMTPLEQARFRGMLNLDMINGLIAIILSFFLPRLAFYLLFFKLTFFISIPFFNMSIRKKGIISEDEKEK